MTSETEETDLLACEECGGQIHAHHALYDDEDRALCEFCYYDLAAECPICREDFTSECDVFLVVDCEAGVRRGIYRARIHPFYTQALLGIGSIDSWAVERLGSVPKRAETDGYPCAFLCPRCAKETLRRTRQQRRFRRNEHREQRKASQRTLRRAA